MDMTPGRKAIHEKLAQAQKLREEGNNKFKTGDTKAALAKYYEALLFLKGLDQSILQQFPHPSKPVTSEKSGLKEVTEEESKKIEQEAAGKEEKDKTPEEKLAEEGENLTKEIKRNMGLVYTNMAACHIKAENWKKALEFAQNATASDSTNSKALFREAQARIALGEVTRGRQILEDLQKNQDDSAVQQALAKLDKDEKARISRDRAQFQGMFNRGKASQDASSSGSRQRRRKRYLNHALLRFWTRMIQRKPRSNL
ncbi:hypothetical protein BT69DRAFT_1351773 [Atractiella rhizophila]|nr:hypothetical protein BT69DRAFT_1351773 [Atractiella rhizophila]